MRKQVIFFLIFSLMSGLLAYPSQSRAIAEVDGLDTEIQDIEEKMKDAEKKAQDSQDSREEVLNDKTVAEQEITTILKNLDRTSEQLTRYNKQIVSLQQNIINTAVQLKEIKNRLTERKKLQDNRVRLMYQNGAVSYINVLLQSNSFMDFIDRIESLKIIIAQDQSIIEQNQADATNISLKQTKMEEQMLEVKELRLQTDQMMSELRLKEQEKQVLIASLEQEQKALLTVSKDQEIKLLDMAREAAALKEKKKTLEEQALKESEHEEHQTTIDSSPSKETELSWPFAKTYPITSPFGDREDPITGEKDTFHKGIDIGAPGGRDILAAQSGTVLLARWTSGYGNTVIIDHGNGMWTLYAHIRMNGIKVEEEEKVNRGQKIAEVGSTGNSTGNHLHFEVRINEEVQNPMDYL